jgi:hypothetical protein
MSQENYWDTASQMSSTIKRNVDSWSKFDLLKFHDEIILRLNHLSASHDMAAEDIDNVDVIRLNIEKLFLNRKDNGEKEI